MEIIIEVKRFIVNNLKRALLVACSTFIVIMGLIFILEMLNGSNSEDENINEQTFTHQFDFYIENPDGTLFSNPSIIKENIIISETYMEIEDKHNVSLIATDDDTNDTNEMEDENLEYKFELNRDSNSGRYTFVLSLDNLSDSRDVIQEFYSLFENDELGILDNKNVVMFSEPYLLDNETDNTTDTDNNSYFKLRNVVLSALLSIAISIGYIILKEILSKTINYYFSYDADKYEYFVLIDKELNNYDYFEKIITGNQVFLSENSTELKKNNDNSAIYDDSLEIKDITNYDEIILIVFPFKTTKQWYKKQKEMLIWHNKPVRIIQVNNFER